MTQFSEYRKSRREPTKSIVVFYHANCTDGFTAAWSAWRKFGDQASYVAVFHEDQPPKDVRGKEVYMLDLTFPKAVTEKLMRENLRVTSIDHHVSVREVALSTKDPLYDVNHSGAVLAWQYFHPTKAIPKFLLSVEDMDLWRLKIKGTKELYAYLEAFDFHFLTWSKLIRDFELPRKRAAMLQHGATILSYQQTLVERIVRRSAYAIRIEGKTVYAVNSSANALHSYMGHRLATMSPSGIGLIWWRAAEGYITVSLRGVGDADVAKLAVRYNGGGHRYAAGFRVASLEQIPWEDIAKPISHDAK